MSFVERDQSNRLLQLLSLATAGMQDPEADVLIREAVARAPAALR